MSNIKKLLLGIGISFLLLSIMLLIIKQIDVAFMFGAIGFGWMMGTSIALLMEWELNEKQQLNKPPNHMGNLDIFNERD